MNNSPKDYLTDRVKEKIELIVDSAFVQGWEAALKLADKHSIDVQVQAIQALLTSEVEKERERLLGTIKDRKKSVEELLPIMGEAYNELSVQVAFKEGYNKALSDIKEEGSKS